MCILTMNIIKLRRKKEQLEKKSTKKYKSTLLVKFNNIVDPRLSKAFG